jgi:PII-like signaling protein
MNGSFLRFYVHEGQRHHHQLVWEWLLQQANKLGIRGGSAFKAMAGFGRHHVLHEAHFGVINPDSADPPVLTSDDQAGGSRDLHQ